MKKINCLQMYVFVTLILMIVIRSSNAQSTSAETFCDRNPSAPECFRKSTPKESQPQTDSNTSTSNKAQPSTKLVTIYGSGTSINGSLKNSSKTGFVVEWSDWNTKKEEYHLVKGIREGKSITYEFFHDANGNVTESHIDSEGEYRSGEKSGKWIENCATNCVRVGNYENDEMVGEWHEYNNFLKDYGYVDDTTIIDGNNTNHTKLPAFPTEFLKYTFREGIVVINP